MVPRISEMIEASRPNEPPVMMSGPDSVAVRIDSSMSPPDTANPNTFPCVKFHAQWMPIGNHSEFVCLYAVGGQKRLRLSGQGKLFGTSQRRLNNDKMD